MPRSDALKKAQKAYRMNKRKEVNISFPIEYYSNLSRFCENKGISVHDAIREGLRLFMEQEQTENAQTGHADND